MSEVVLPGSKHSVAADVEVVPEQALSGSRMAARNIRRTVLKNGLLVLTETMPHVRSVSMGVWVGAGSRDEAAEVNGISHFVEHMVFKGTTSRTAQDIAREVDGIGGNLDAFTGKETTCFNIKVLDEKAPQALDVLADLVLHPTFAEDDLKRERDVVLEEIKMDEDNPDYLVHETFVQNFWKGAALGRPILGTVATVGQFSQRTVFDHHAGQFTPAKMVFSAAGNLKHDEFVAQVEEQFAGLGAASGSAPQAKEPGPETFAHITLKKKKSLEQVQMCLGVPAPAVADESRYAVYLLNTILGGGMSSRLFQSIREEQGLAYSIYSEMSPFRDTGSLCVFAGTSVDKTERLVRLTMAELRRLKDEPIGEVELERAKNQLKSNMVLGLESSGSRMSNLARQQMYYGRFFGVDEVTASIEAVDSASLQQIAKRLFRTEVMALTLLGNLGTMKVTRDHLAC